ncbi:phosphoglycerate dehydrogenase [Solidesulfovibrio sp.]|uniref:phosphoglycerate dehydrogenase n=1 Tax=Solidesulfovibrio sp. TaxID=2910990 RepID=UPI0026037438|nr:phosphoglycerate dehydrogenase [Solidesulfovibrio sp.]
MKWKVLVTAPYLQPVLDRFRGELEARGVALVVPPVSERLEEEELLPLMAEIDGVMCGDDRFTRRVIEASPRLKVLSKWGTGVDSLDAAACRERGVAIRRTPDAFSVPVAETVLGFVLAFTRQIVAGNADMHRGRWQKLPGRVLAECTLGVIGVGDTGKAVTRAVRPLGMRVLGHDIREIPAAFVEETGLCPTGLDVLLEQADFVSLHTDLNPTSFHLMNDARFERMRPGAVLINTSRGPVVDEQALVRALASGRIAGAALDVFEQEPLPADSPLLAMDNVLMSPHNANSSSLYWEKIHRRTIDSLLGVLEGGK